MVKINAESLGQPVEMHNEVAEAGSPVVVATETQSRSDGVSIAEANAPTEESLLAQIGRIAQERARQEAEEHDRHIATNRRIRNWARDETEKVRKELQRIEKAKLKAK